MAVVLLRLYYSLNPCPALSCLVLKQSPVLLELHRTIKNNDWPQIIRSCYQL